MAEIFQNLRANYDFAAPGPELAEYVEFFAESVSPSTRPAGGFPPRVGVLFASWTPTCYVNLGPAYAIALGARHYRVAAGEAVLRLLHPHLLRR